MITTDNYKAKMTLNEFKNNCKAFATKLGAKTITYKRVRLAGEGVVTANLKGSNNEHITSFSFFTSNQMGNFITLRAFA